MDAKKKAALIASIAGEPESMFATIREFFEGNDDLGSIGCNLVDHPGIRMFEDILAGLLQRNDIEGVYTQIAELDPGDGCWPFTDTILVAGSISLEELREILEPLQPDEVEPALDIPRLIQQRHKGPWLYAWWD